MSLNDSKIIYSDQGICTYFIGKSQKNTKAFILHVQGFDIAMAS